MTVIPCGRGRMTDDLERLQLERARLQAKLRRATPVEAFRLKSKLWYLDQKIDHLYMHLSMRQEVEWFGY